MTNERKPIIDVLNGRRPERIPFWLMRQAGRYLPEYLALRKEAGSFLNLVYNPVRASEVTVQPLRRFGMDAAILFSDILVVPHALGQDVTFEAGEGPRLDPVRTPDGLKRLDPTKVDTHCAPIYETVSRTREMLAKEGFDTTALIGFCGSPWTVICYMVEGGGSRDFEKAKHWAFSDPENFSKLVDIVVEASCAYLSGQVRAGAEVIQLFESWGGLLDPWAFRRWIIDPTRRIRDYLRGKHPGIPVIGFPRGAGVLLSDYARDTGVDCVGLDPTIDPAWAARSMDPGIALQGNLDPVRLLCGGSPMEEAMDRIEQAMRGRQWIFNLGHGVIKETDIGHIGMLRDRVRSWKP